MSDTPGSSRPIVDRWVNSTLACLRPTGHDFSTASTPFRAFESHLRAPRCSAGVSLKYIEQSQPPGSKMPYSRAPSQTNESLFPLDGKSESAHGTASNLRSNQLKACRKDRSSASIREFRERPPRSTAHGLFFGNVDAQHGIPATTLDEVRGFVPTV